MLKALVLGEEERGQSQYQVMCFVTKLQRGDFISADAMAKLRQVSTRPTYSYSVLIEFTAMHDIPLLQRTATDHSPPINSIIIIIDRSWTRKRLCVWSV